MLMHCCHFYFYLFAIEEEYSDIAGNLATCYVHFDRSAIRMSGTLVTKIKQCV
jgi:hypothetical protein